jgi:hypothetical protein
MISLGILVGYFFSTCKVSELLIINTNQQTTINVAENEECKKSINESQAGCQRRKVLPDEAPRLYSIDEKCGSSGR